MPSNPPQLETMRADVDALVAPLLPATWRRRPHVGALPTAFRRPILVTEFTGINIGQGSTRAASGWAWADCDLVIAIPTTADGKGEDEADAAVAKLIRVLDATAPSGLGWDVAKKERLESGQLIWRVSVSILVRLNPTT